jgi:hypothetical protein
MPYSVSDRIEAHRRFWDGDGPSLIYVPTGHEGYLLDDYVRRFHDPEAMWQSEILRARHVVDWPTDGIPAVRPNLGVTFIPSVAGQNPLLSEGKMPWPGSALGRDTISAAADIDIADTEMMRLAREFYEIHASANEKDVYAYHADTQGVFDVAHLLYQDEVFYEIADPSEVEWIAELMKVSGDLYAQVSAGLKEMIGEESGEMIHGHGTTQGVYFPHAGVRMAEDTPTLISPEMIERIVLPAIEKYSRPFGGAFIHYCGRHEPLFEMLCGMECVRAIDLGNAEMYDTRWLLERCAESGTVLHSHIATEYEDEPWRDYTRRLGAMVRETEARVILRPDAAPDGSSPDEAAEMLDMWHELTTPA